MAGEPSIEGALQASTGSNGEEKPKETIFLETAFEAEKNPSGGSLRSEELLYRVVAGDTLSKIASDFNITVSTILSANKKIQGRALKIGEEIVILPVAGIIHTRREGESIEAIAELYDISIDALRGANKNLAKETIIVPGVVVERSMKDFTTQNLPRLEGYFIMPTTGLNWGELHEENGVDIANSCGTPVFAAAAGIVSSVRFGWDSGYGTNIVIEHPNGVETRYAHLSKTLVSAGEYLLQGDEIGSIGNTGLTHGKTGCHLHFEVDGARNPFVK